MQRNSVNIQDSFLNQARKEKMIVTIHLLDGSEVDGRIMAFDNFTVILFSDREQKNQHLLYKHSIAMITPSTRINWGHGPHTQTPNKDRA